jgi:hypothetical protein
MAATALIGVVLLIGLFVGRALAEGQGAIIDFGRVSGSDAAVVGAVVYAGLISLAGYGLGLITRSTPVAISVLIVWPLIAEGLIAGLIGVISGWKNVQGWMPFQAGFRLWFVGIDDLDGPSRIVGGLYFGGVALALTAIGAVAVNRRDA